VLTLRLTEYPLGGDRWRVESALDEHGDRRVVTTEFRFAVPEADRERVRWYLEDFPEYPAAPAPAVAVAVEELIARIGHDLHDAVFGGADGGALWSRVEDRLAEVRVEVVADASEPVGLPWELWRHPRSGVVPALRARSFVRARAGSAAPVVAPRDGDDRLRVLLVISRPAVGDDVAFRSVVRQLVHTLGGSDAVRLDVLRPPTFTRLEEVLQAAALAGSPYDVVHFDGHGTYTGSRGYLRFEEPGSAGNATLVDGCALGTLLSRAGVPVLVLDACRSAYAEATAQLRPGRPHDVARAHGSLAQEVLDAGVPGVVAMRYRVSAAAAAQFSAALYAALLAGEPLADAVTAGRRHLREEPARSVAVETRRLEDWVVPVVFQTAPVELVRPAHRDARTAVVDDGLPRHPDTGFVGRDETLLALDRTFDDHPVVLLRAFAGAGKTTTAVEFARWYRATGGTDGLVFSGFAHHRPLAGVLNDLGAALGGLLEARGVRWGALDDAGRRAAALELCAEVPILWIWDSVEPVGGLPAGAASRWSREEQAELTDFLRELAGTRAKVLLTSRRDERGWLGDLPARVALPPMPMPDRLRLTAALARRAGHRIEDGAAWQPLLRYAGGNPPTTTVLVEQALRDGLGTADEISGFAERLRTGEVGPDDPGEDRSHSLGASLGYGFAQAFTDVERAQLAVLHLFRDNVDVDALVWLGGERSADGQPLVPVVAELDRSAGVALLDRAAEVGVLTAGPQPGLYTIHPALPWLLTTLFRQHHGEPGSRSAESAVRAYATTMGALGEHYLRKDLDGHRWAVEALAAEEGNLLHALGLARRRRWWEDAVCCAQGLGALYRQPDRGADWAALVDRLTPDFTDPDTDGPLPGLEQEWGLVTEYRIKLARGRRDLSTALRLQRLNLAVSTERAAAALAIEEERRGDYDRYLIRTLAVDHGHLANILRDLRDPDCVGHYERSTELAGEIGDLGTESRSASDLGEAYLEVPGIRDLDRAEQWFRQAQRLGVRQGRFDAVTLSGKLGSVAYHRFLDARAGGAEPDVLRQHLATALRYYRMELDALPRDSFGSAAAARAADQISRTEQLLAELAKPGSDG